MNDNIPALSVRQPWPWAMIYAGKNIENRYWSTNYRGKFYIHAAKGMTRSEYQDFEMFYEPIRRGTKLPLCPAPALLQKGGIIGVANLVDCVTVHSSPWFTGKYGFVLEDIKPVEFIPLRGQLGFFNVDLDDKEERLV